LLLATLGACADSTSPPSLQPRAPARSTEVNTTLTIPVDPNTGSGWVTLPDFPTARWIEVTVSGKLPATWRSNGVTFGTWGPGGLFHMTGIGPACDLYVYFDYTQGQDLPVPNCGNGVQETFVDTIWVQGSATAGRTGPLQQSNNCEGGQCFYYSGSQSIYYQDVATAEPDARR
jgi:hypothetical protein